MNVVFIGKRRNVIFYGLFLKSLQDWTLKIKYVQPRDAGVYECQVSTHPPSSIFVKLNVVEARAEIAGGPDKYIKTGSSLRLICELKQSTEEPDYVFWYQGLQMINYDPIRQIEVTHDRYTSTLVLHNVQKSDSGNYSCVPSKSIPASIFVHIINVPQFVDFNNITHHHQEDDDEALFLLPTSRG
ncbi:unnamed protein product [Allacma fusca]|uniref:Ig-like domain-containing protein n=1 Tax=Allacma fusca TaxID=39272 RepID=A0A8J2LSV5_9HEXA|nr:unnamed protein product [Allacma fusca]